MAIPSYQERMITEKDELHDRLVRLDEFIDGATFAGLSKIARDFLTEQREHMANYLEVLHLRIEQCQLTERPNA